MVPRGFPCCGPFTTLAGGAVLVSTKNSLLLRGTSAQSQAATAPSHIHVPTRANRQPAFAVFLSGAPGARPRPFALEVLRIHDGLIAEIDVFLQPKLLERFAVTPPNE